MKLINEARRMQQLAGILKESSEIISEKSTNKDYASELVYKNPKPLSNLHTAIDEVIAQLIEGDEELAKGRKLTVKDIMIFLKDEFKIALEDVADTVDRIAAGGSEEKKKNIPGTDFSMNEDMSVGGQGGLQSTGSDEEADKAVLMAWADKWNDTHNEWTFEGITDEIDKGLILTKLAAIYYEEYLTLKKDDERGDSYTIENYIEEELENNPPNVISLEDLGEYTGYVSPELEKQIDAIYDKDNDNS